MDLTVEHYVRRFAGLRTDRSRARWPAITRHRAPHKPLLLLAVLDLFAQGSIERNQIELGPALGELFTSYWGRVMPPDQRGNLALPFFHLKSEGFWHLIPLPGKGEVLAGSSQIRSVNRLRETVSGARLEDELYTLLRDETPRHLLRTVLIDTYFATEAQRKLSEQAVVNLEAFRYSQELLARTSLVGEALRGEGYRTAVRDQGFRRAIVFTYDHRCAFCGIRVLTVDGHTAVDASHIVPWSVSQDDRPTNGMALCRLCHWTFDEGLLGISPQSYEILVSPQLVAARNLPGHLPDVEGRLIVGPAETTLWPDPSSLEWHRRRVFRTS